VSASSPNSITIGWAAPNGGATITGYDVFRDGVKLTRTTSRLYMAGSLAGSTTYSFTVQACNLQGCSASPAAVSATTKPTAATSLKAAPAAAQLDFTWTSNGGAGSVDSVWYRASNSSVFAEWTPGVADVSGTKITGLQNGTSYSLKVRTTAGVDVWSESAVTIGVPMDTPAVVAVGYKNLTMTSLTLNWAATTTGAKPSFYEVYRDGAKISQVSTLYVNVTGLVTLQRYAFTVKSCNLSGCSAASAPLELTMPPSPPSKLTGTAAANKVTLSWAVAPGAMPHSVWYKLANQTAWTEFTPGVADVAPTEVTGLVGGSIYNFRVGVTSPDGTTSFSQPISLTPLGVPATPLNLRQTAGSATAATVTWTAPFNGGTPITGYRVFRDGTLVAQPGATTTTLALSGLVIGSKYDITVQACNVVGCSESTAVREAFTLPVAVTGVAGAVSATSATLTWDAATTPAVPGYKIFFRRVGAPAWTEHTPGVDDPSGTVVSGLAAVSNYQTYVRAYNTAGFVDSAIATFSTTTFLAPTSPVAVTATAGISSARLIINNKPIRTAPFSRNRRYVRSPSDP
jgi:hypothetical protein